MLGGIDVYSVNRMSYGISTLLTLTVIKGALVFGIVHLFVSKSKGLTPTQRHLFWLCAVSSCLLAPFLSYLAFPIRVIEPSFLAEKRSAAQAASAEFRRWSFPLQLKTVWRTESGSFSCIDKASRLHRLSWESWAAIVWAAVAFYSLAMMGAAHLRLVEMSRSADPATRPAHTRLLRDLAGRAGIGREVRLLFSAKCRVPFAWNLLNPKILMPADAVRWRQGRLRAVLTHELAHLRRRDHLVRLLSRVVCSFLWFVPYVWVAHSKMHDEQEQACDEITVREGAAPADFAGHLVALARSLSNCGAVYTGVFLLKPHKSRLERRVAALLDATRRLPRPSPAGFAVSLLLFVLFSLPLLLLNPTVGEPIKSRFDAKASPPHIAGTWVNAEYGYVRFPPLPQKMVITTSGELGLWGRADNLGPSQMLSYRIARCWRGKDGALYVNAYVIHPVLGMESSTELWRIARSGALLETMYRRGIVDEFPKMICATPSPKSPDNYSVYYREFPDRHARARGVKTTP